MADPHSPLRLNVGFVAHQATGYSREFTFDIAQFLLYPDLRLSNLSGACRFSRTPQGLLLQAKFHTMLPLDCVRCLNQISQTLDTDFTELYAFSKRNATDSELIFPDDGHIDLEPLVREYMLLEIPISPLCDQDCQGLCSICGGNLNETACDHDPETGDPRLAALKALLEE